MYAIFYDGKDRGVWDDDNIDRLAAKLGATVEELKAETAAHVEEKKKNRAFKDAVKEQAGDTGKILSITADAATLGLLVSSALITAINEVPESEFKTAFIGGLNDVIPAREGEPDIFEVMAGFRDAVKSGDIGIVGNIKGAGAVIDNVSDCNSAVAGILTSESVDGEG